MIFCFKNSPGTLSEKKILVIKKKVCKFEVEGQEFTKHLRSQEQFIQTLKCQNNF